MTDDAVEKTTSEAPESAIEVNDINAACMDDPVLVIQTRQMVRYENNVLLAQYDEICLECVSGDKRVPGHEHLKKQADPLCKTCKGTGRIPRAVEDE